MSDAPKITRGIRLPVMTPEEIERNRAELQDAIKAAADTHMQTMAELARQAIQPHMDAAQAMSRVMMPDLSELTRQAFTSIKPKVRETLIEFERPDHSRLEELLKQDRERERKALAAEIAAAMVQAQGKSEPAPAAQAEPATPETAQRNHTEARAGELAAVLDAIEARAVECGWPLVRTNWPGTKAEFRAFLKWYARGLAYSLPADNGNLSDNLRPHGVTFGKPGRSSDKGQKMYQALFPDYPA